MAFGRTLKPSLETWHETIKSVAEDGYVLLFVLDDGEVLTTAEAVLAGDEDGQFVIAELGLDRKK